MPTFCRHNRFLERCPICSKDLPGQPSGGGASRSASSRERSAARTGSSSPRRARGTGLLVRREGRAAEDGYSSELVPGLRASADAQRLAEEIAFSSGRLGVLALQPPGLYGEAHVLARGDLERASWICFLIAYLSPLEDEDPFAGVRMLLQQVPALADVQTGERTIDLADIPLGPRTSHDPGRGAETLKAYGEWAQRGGRPGAGPAMAPSGSEQAAIPARQAMAFTGDPEWSPQRRFERLFERLALPGFARRGRFDLLVTMGRLGLYELQPGSLHLTAARGSSGEDPTTTAAKRVFGIGDPLLLERRAAMLADTLEVPLETLDLALENWASPQRASMGVAAATCEEGVLERAREALGI